MRRSYKALPRYRSLPVIDGEKPERVRVVVRKGKHEGFVARWTDNCSGCTEYGDYGTTYGPSGCDECGYTGRRRRRAWVPFDAHAYDQHMTRVFDRYERWRDNRNALRPERGEGA